MSTAISIKNVTKTFIINTEKRNTFKEYFLSPWRKDHSKVFRAVDDLSFDIQHGEFFGIVGRNGSGKSTLLKMIAGIYEPNEGSIEAYGSLVPFLELGVGFNFDLNAVENVYLNGTILGLTKDVIDHKVKEIIDFAEIGEFQNLQLKNFSSGMQVRLAFSIAINIPADIYLIDEVLAVGDIQFQEKCINVFKNMKKEKKTIIFVSHDLGSIERFCDRAALIEDHKLRMIGEPKKVIEEYQKIMSHHTN